MNQLSQVSPTPWWENREAALRFLNMETDHLFAGIPVGLKALQDRTKACGGTVLGKLVHDGQDQLLTAALEQAGFHVWNDDEDEQPNSARWTLDVTLVHPDAALRISTVNDSMGTTLPDYRNVRWTASNPYTDSVIRRVVAEHITECLIEEKPRAQVYGFSFERGSYVMRSLGELNDEFIPTNYASTVAEKYRYVVDQLLSPDPAGRLVLLEGEPGTGKTRLIRSLITELNIHSQCVLVPPSLLDNLSGPDFARCLLENQVDGRPITLVLEDADDCLISREKNEAAKASLSALLNLSDGIAGAMLNLRVIATTNQKIQSVDKAILRPGRLIERIHIGSLTPAQADVVAARLRGVEVDNLDWHYTEPTTLAAVYQDCRGR